MAWTDKNIETLKRCAREGKSFSDCAAELGPAFTRNMVAGKAGRLGVQFSAMSKGSFTSASGAEASRLGWAKPGQRERMGPLISAGMRAARLRKGGKAS